MCENDLAKSNPEVIDRIRQIFTEAHVDSEWYVNPGESKTQIAAKRAKATSMKSMQRSTSANTAYSGRTEQSPPGDALKAASEE